MNFLGASYEILKHNFSIVSIMISIDYARNLRGHLEKEPHKLLGCGPQIILNPIHYMAHSVSLLHIWYLLPSNVNMSAASSKFIDTKGTEYAILSRYETDISKKNNF